MGEGKSLAPRGGPRVPLPLPWRMCWVPACPPVLLPECASTCSFPPTQLQGDRPDECTRVWPPELGDSARYSVLRAWKGWADPAFPPPLTLLLHCTQQEGKGSRGVPYQLGGAGVAGAQVQARHRTLLSSSRTTESQWYCSIRSVLQDLFGVSSALGVPGAVWGSPPIPLALSGPHPWAA